MSLFDEMLKQYYSPICKAGEDFCVQDIEPGVNLTFSSHVFRYMTIGNELYHRWDGPSRISVGLQSWYHYGRHIVDLYDNGSVCMSADDYVIWLAENNINYTNLSNEDKILIKMVWG